LMAQVRCYRAMLEVSRVFSHIHLYFLTCPFC
jgi:hypothetical protein